MTSKRVEKQDASDSCRLYVGTSGYAYKEWMDAGFYPAGIKSSGMLSFYAERFSITELNYTWYQMPKVETVERQRRQVPSEFLFAAKLNRTLTHEIDPGNWRKKAAYYREGVAPFMQAGQLAALLVQLPPSFTRTQTNRSHLAALLDTLDGLPLAVEFRHKSWVHDRVFAELERRRVTLVSVDEPDLPGLFPALDVVTCPNLFYVRFHGRNASGWRSGNMQNQFDYKYSDDQLREWVRERIVPMAHRAKKGIIFFNNHVRAQAVENAFQMVRILAEEGLGAR
ncbi:MAG: DUF72 domain-containing protein [Deltaproteobacteria bacterium]|nr:DUF72 domain-containing protein [Deltaproteobacteria bacterium]